MTATPIQCLSPRLEAIAITNGRVRSEVCVKSRGSRITLHFDEINLARAEDRERFVGRFSPDMRDEARTLILETAEAVAAHKATAKQSTPKAADPFPAIEPWPDEVDGVLLLGEIRDCIERYMVLPRHASDVLALWTVHTYVFHVGDYTPYLLVTSPTRECGKSTLLDLLANLAHRAQLTGGITAAALYRRIARLAPTMLLDELDTRLRGDGGELLRGVLNTGFHRSGKITICVGDDHEEKDFATYCPKVLAGIGRVWDTVTSRSIPIRLARASKEELARLDRVRGDRIAEETLDLRRKLARLAIEITPPLAVTDSVTPSELGARQSDVWRPLLGIADVVGGGWPDRARTAALALHGVAEEEGDLGLLVLGDVRSICSSTTSPVVATDYILQELTKREDRPWPEYRHGKPITARGLASLLGRFGIKPKQHRLGVEITRGYDVTALRSVFNAYLPPETSVTPVTPLPTTEAVTVVTGALGNPDDDEQYDMDERMGLADGL